MPPDFKIPGAETLLEALLENCAEYIYFKDRKSRFVRCSRSLWQLFATRFPDGIQGKTDFDIFDAQHASEAFADEQRIMATGVPVVGKLEREVHMDGRVTWCISTKMPWRDASGEILGTFGISRDATAQKTTELELADERELMRVLFAEIPDTIYFKDRQSRFVRLSRSKIEGAQTILVQRFLEQHPGCSPADLPPHLQDLQRLGEWLKGKTDFDLQSASRAQENYEEEQEIIRTGKPMVGRIDCAKLPDGSSRWSIITKLPWRSPSGEIVGTFGITKNITEIKEAELKLERAHQQLVETSHMAGMAEVAIGVLHNVGNALNSVNVSCECIGDVLNGSKVDGVGKIAALLREHTSDLGTFLSETPKGKQIPEYLSKLATHLASEKELALKELNALRQSVEHIRTIVTMQQNYAKVSGVRQPVTADELVNEAIQINASSVARHDVRVSVFVEPGLTLTTEKHKILQILINLIRNAIQACDRGTALEKRIDVRAESTGKMLRLTVTDNGEGIPLENLHRIFAHGFTTKPNGHGFGLHTGALAAKELGGTLTANSEGAGKGATFVLELPLK
jgi:PAS domain S-box-containing protein